ncbi:transposase [Aliidiomarina shirensis]|uniref:Transposase n=1 Tax=Aliidiomarina shirensis TaxID=1048642 RepID=A0A432WU36_9GAMM|nr:transposase [Aliidiomarina shirensis]RUO37286.1 transposase [Aliidiomarina shirensis]
MPRRRRAYVPGIGAHVIQRGNNRQITFKDDSDRSVFVSYLIEYLVEFDVKIHAWVLMSNHFHFYCTSEHKWGISRFIQILCSRYTRYFNKRHGRTGTLWEGRYYSAMVQSAKHSLNLYKYIEQNPVKAGLVARAGDFHWSSYATNARGVPSSICTPHPDYLALGKNDQERRSEYRRLFSFDCSSEFLEDIRSATMSNGALGDEAFLKRLSDLTGVSFECHRKRKVSPEYCAVAENISEDLKV